MFERRPPAAPPHAALVTGATSGIGQAFAMALPPSTNLVLSGRDADRLAALEGTLASPLRSVRTVAADLASADGRDAVVAAALAMDVDLLINNAGLGQMGPFLATEAEASLAAIEVNVVACVALARALLPAMLARAAETGRRAGLINVASTAAFVPVPQMAVYAASKAFLLSFGESLKVELADRPIDIATLCPGPVRTAFAERAGYAGRALPGTIEPETVASLALERLGRHGVVFTDPLSEAALKPLTLARAAVARTLRLGFDLNERWQQRGSRDRPHNEGPVPRP